MTRPARISLSPDDLRGLRYMRRVDKPLWPGCLKGDARALDPEIVRWRELGLIAPVYGSNPGYILTALGLAELMARDGGAP